jgi:hypothetical protein
VGPLASGGTSRRVGKLVGYPPLSEMSAEQRREFHEALLDADDFEDLPGKCKRQSSRQSRTGRTCGFVLILHNRRRSPSLSRPMLP